MFGPKIAKGCCLLMSYGNLIFTPFLIWLANDAYRKDNLVGTGILIGLVIAVFILSIVFHKLYKSLDKVDKELDEINVGGGI